MMTSFTKYSANGNHFILLDHMQNQQEITTAQVLTWCDSVFGIGADGLAEISPHDEFAFRFRLWNSDGGEAEMCGNAARAAAWHYLKNNPTLKSVKFKTMNGVYQANLEEDRLWIQMSEQRQDLNLPPRLRHHRMFPNGTNVDFISVNDPAQPVVQLRVYERGVEGETWSCGTGVAAVAWACRIWHGWLDDIRVITKGGEHRVRFSDGKLWYSGEIKKVFTGELL
jgi:diaminopimelate epimerase